MCRFSYLYGKMARFDLPPEAWTSGTYLPETVIIATPIALYYSCNWLQPACWVGFAVSAKNLWLQAAFILDVPTSPHTSVIHRWACTQSKYLVQVVVVESKGRNPVLPGLWYQVSYGHSTTTASPLECLPGKQSRANPVPLLIM